MQHCILCREPLEDGHHLAVCWRCAAGIAGHNGLTPVTTGNAGAPQSVALDIHPLEVGEDGWVTAILMAAGVLKGKGLYAPAHVVEAAQNLFAGKPVFLDHAPPPLGYTPEMRPEKRKLGTLTSVWAEAGAVLGKFFVEDPAMLSIVRGLKDLGEGGMSAVIDYLENRGNLTEITDVKSVDVVLTPSSEDAKILAASQTATETAPSWGERFMAFLAQANPLPQMLRPQNEPAQQEPAASPLEVTMDAELKTFLDQFKTDVATQITEATGLLQTSVNEQLVKQTTALSETTAQVEALAKRQTDMELEGYRKKKMKDKMSADLPDTPAEMLDAMIDALYAGRPDEEAEEAMLARVDTYIAPLKAAAEAQKAALAAANEPAEETPAEEQMPPVVIPGPTALSLALSAQPNATIPSGNEALAEFSKKFNADIKFDENGRPSMATAGANGNAPTA